MYRDEVVYPLQADLRIVRRSTIERKQMSTKTTFKRIALVAVAALGFGVLSTVPSSATVAGATVTVTNGAASTLLAAVRNTTGATLTKGTAVYISGATGQRSTVSKALANLGYASGTLLDRSSDVVADASKTGIDILHGTVDSVGDLLIKASGQGAGGALDIHINQPPTIAPNPPEPNSTTNPIQNNTSAKSQWCLVGEYNGPRGCISVSEGDKCLSGQVFPSQHQCLNPNLSQNKS
jgi:hypothetical protein